MEHDVVQHTQPIVEEHTEQHVEDYMEPIDYGQWEELVANGRVPGPITLEEYFSLPESNERDELLYGWRVREVPVPKHQFAVSNLAILIGMHLMETGLGRIMTPSSDILFDEETRLVLVPDAIVLLHDRMHVVGEKRLHGPPNLVVEALSPSTSRRDRVHKLNWYRKYGVDEYWIVDSTRKHVEVVDLTASPEPAVSRFVETDKILSRVLPGLNITADLLFAPLYQAAVARVGLVKPGESSTSYARPKRS